MKTRNNSKEKSERRVEAKRGLTERERGETKWMRWLCTLGMFCKATCKWIIRLACKNSVGISWRCSNWIVMRWWTAWEQRVFLGIYWIWASILVEGMGEFAPTESSDMKWAMDIRIHQILRAYHILRGTGHLKYVVCAWCFLAEANIH